MNISKALKRRKTITYNNHHHCHSQSHCHDGFMKGVSVYVTPSVIPAPNIMKKLIERRSFIKKSVLAGIGIPLLGSQLLACNNSENSKKLKFLILGGSSFLGPHQIAYALSKGHSISIFTRGKTNQQFTKKFLTRLSI